LDVPRALVDSEHGKLVMVIDDDELVRDGTRAYGQKIETVEKRGVA
jgi:hypothetical protein